MLGIAYIQSYFFCEAFALRLASLPLEVGRHQTLEEVRWKLCHSFGRVQKCISHKNKRPPRYILRGLANHIYDLVVHFLIPYVLTVEHTVLVADREAPKRAWGQDHVYITRPHSGAVPICHGISVPVKVLNRSF